MLILAKGLNRSCQSILVTAYDGCQRFWEKIPKMPTNIYKNMSKFAIFVKLCQNWRRLLPSLQFRNVLAPSAHVLSGIFPVDYGKMTVVVQ